MLLLFACAPAAVDSAEPEVDPCGIDALKESPPTTCFILENEWVGPVHPLCVVPETTAAWDCADGVETLPGESVLYVIGIEPVEVWPLNRTEELCDESRVIQPSGIDLPTLTVHSLEGEWNGVEHLWPCDIDHPESDD